MIPVIENNHHIDNQDTVQELINLIGSSPDQFKHLQVFLHRERQGDFKTDNKFLMVTPRVFGKVEMLDLKVEGDYIIVDFMDCAMQEVGNVRINISDDKPSVLFICWQDVRKIVFDETISSYCDNDLLEFDYE